MNEKYIIISQFHGADFLRNWQSTSRSRNSAPFT